MMNESKTTIPPNEATLPPPKKKLWLGLLCAQLGIMGLAVGTLLTNNQTEQAYLQLTAGQSGSTLQTKSGKSTKLGFTLTVKGVEKKLQPARLRIFHRACGEERSVAVRPSAKISCDDDAYRVTLIQHYKHYHAEEVTLPRKTSDGSLHPAVKIRVGRETGDEIFTGWLISSPPERHSVYLLKESLLATLIPVQDESEIQADVKGVVEREGERLFVHLASKGLTRSFPAVVGDSYFPEEGLRVRIMRRIGNFAKRVLSNPGKDSSDPALLVEWKKDGKATNFWVRASDFGKSLVRTRKIRGFHMQFVLGSRVLFRNYLRLYVLPSGAARLVRFHNGDKQAEQTVVLKQAVLLEPQLEMKILSVKADARLDFLETNADINVVNSVIEVKVDSANGEKTLVLRENAREWDSLDKGDFLLRYSARRLEMRERLVRVQIVVPGKPPKTLEIRAGKPFEVEGRRLHLAPLDTGNPQRIRFLVDSNQGENWRYGGMILVAVGWLALTISLLRKKG